MTVCSDDKNNFDIGSGQTIKHSDSFKYLGVTLAANGKSSNDVSNKIAQEKRLIRQLNSMLWNKKLTKRTKHLISDTIFETITTYGTETWELTQREKEEDFWRRSSGVSRLEHVRNGKDFRDNECRRKYLGNCEEQTA
ncbi:hypothetical protein HHI36_017262 [Cryptolaemus montrouzieri]|uniref:Uncharacterized protein n=1 Tax=Cryptolaemus montrouzieri TaxID=559131 RepID=A0ABD2NMK0_9CUCU